MSVSGGLFSPSRLLAPCPLSLSLWCHFVFSPPCLSPVRACGGAWSAVPSCGEGLRLVCSSAPLVCSVPSCGAVWLAARRSFSRVGRRSACHAFLVSVFVDVGWLRVGGLLALRWLVSVNRRGRRGGVACRLCLCGGWLGSVVIV